MLFFSSGCYILGLDDTPEPKYKLILEEKDDNHIFQVREYENLVIAETTINTTDFRKMGNVGFKRLGGYITGKNKKEEEIQMTAPVLLDEDSDNKTWKMIFILPKEYSLDKAPEPENQSVIVKKMINKWFAVIQFSSSLSKKRFDEHAEELSKWMKEKNYKLLSDPILAVYNPPFTLPFLRRNEVFIEIAHQ